MRIRNERLIYLCRRIAGGFILLAMSSMAAMAGGALDPVSQPEAHHIKHINPAKLSPELRRTIVRAPRGYAVGTVIVDTDHRHLYLVVDHARAIRYGIAVGRRGKTWHGQAVVGKKRKWPTWTPTPGMTSNSAMVTFTFEGGSNNPLGARALYLYANGKDTAYRLHGSGDARTLGKAVSYGCIRMLDQDVVDLYERVPVGAQVVILGSTGKALSSMFN